MSEHTQDSHAANAHSHIVPIRTYVVIALTLAAMTCLTVAVAWVDLGPANIFVALAIAAFKGSLVVLFFMHVKYSSKLVQLASVTGFLWLAIMLSFTFTDYWTESWQPVEGWTALPVDAYATQHDLHGHFTPEVDYEGAAGESGGHE